MQWNTFTFQIQVLDTPSLNKSEFSNCSHFSPIQWYVQCYAIWCKHITEVHWIYQGLYYSLLYKAHCKLHFISGVMVITNFLCMYYKNVMFLRFHESRHPTFCKNLPWIVRFKIVYIMSESLTDSTLMYNINILLMKRKHADIAPHLKNVRKRLSLSEKKVQYTY